MCICKRIIFLRHRYTIYFYDIKHFPPHMDPPTAKPHIFLKNDFSYSIIIKISF